MAYEALIAREHAGLTKSDLGELIHQLELETGGKDRFRRRVRAALNQLIQSDYTNPYLRIQLIAALHDIDEGDDISEIRARVATALHYDLQIFISHADLVGSLLRRDHELAYNTTPDLSDEVYPDEGPYEDAPSADQS